jgi:L-fuconolactonase
VRIDAHQHFWRFDPIRDAWITPAMDVIRRDFLPDDLAPHLHAVKVDGVVAVQADQSDAETAFLLDLAAHHAFVRGVVGWIDLRAADLTSQLARFRDAESLKGFRHIAQAEPDDFLARPEVIAGVQTLGRHGYSYDVLVYPRQVPAAAQLAAACPDTTLVLDHCAKPPIATGDLTTWRRDLARLAEHEHVSCKLSGLVTEASWRDWRYDQLEPVLDTALDLFGPARLMFGSDWPVCLLAASYGQVYAALERWASRLSAAEQAEIFGDTATRVYRLTPPPA